MESGEWDSAALAEWFNQETVDTIRSIPLSKNWPTDSQFWWPSKDGLYSVKSGYWLGLCGANRFDEDNQTLAWRKQWNNIWKLPAPPKLRQFMWRVCKGSLATKHVLYNRYCVQSAMCDRCNSEPETILHALCDCPNNEAVWRLFPAADIWRDAPRTTAADFVLWVCNHCSAEVFVLLCTTLWAVWFFRNKEVFTNERCDPVQLTMSLHKLVEDFNLYAAKSYVLHHEPLLKYQSWCPPFSGWVKINFDAHVGVGSLRGLGVVIRDDGGKLLLAGVRRVHANWDAEMSEAAAARYGVELAARFGYHLVQLEGDALAVVRAIEKRQMGLSPIHLFYDDIIRLCLCFEDFGCSFVSRNGNTLAHFVARWDTGVGNERICMDPFPQGLLTLAELDL